MVNAGFGSSPHAFLSLQSYPTYNLLSSLQTLDTSYYAIRTRKNWKTAFLLQIHHASLILFAEFLQSRVLSNNEGLDLSTDPVRAELRMWNLRILTQRSYDLKRYSEMGYTLARTTESLLDVVRVSAPITNSPRRTSKFMAIDAELRACCRDTREKLQGLSSSLEHDLKFLELSRNVNQTRGVQRLTLVATIFLPLSLAAGILSMQTRFKDLGTLLYDFVGVVVLLGAIVVVIVIGMNIFAGLKDQENELQQNRMYRVGIHGKLTSILTLCLISYGSLIFASFLVGMFKDLALGGKILGYGSAAALAPMLLCFLLGGLMATCYWGVSACRRARRSRVKTDGQDVERKSELTPDRNQDQGGILVSGQHSDSGRIASQLA